VILTLAPLLVEVDDLVDDVDVGEAAALGLPDDLGVVPLLFPEQIDVQHSAPVSVSVSLSLEGWRKRKEETKSRNGLCAL